MAERIVKFETQNREAHKALFQSKYKFLEKLRETCHEKYGNLKSIFRARMNFVFAHWGAAYMRNGNTIKSGQVDFIPHWWKNVQGTFFVQFVQKACIV